ncbi:hypothetical protein H8E88_25285 [candidate division KSB1 bacterium]|nr:hypothetical protein [candidate division KSB1 bacterium]MBL7094961.1 hypothetical protein [candidate division KSB1 bacterium]
MKKHIIFYVALLSTILSISNIFSQTSISVSQSLAYYSNSFYNYKQLPDVNDNLGLKASHIFKGETVQSRIFYQGDLNYFKTYSDRLYHNQAFGYDGYTVSSDNKRTLYFGANWRMHDGKDIYDFFDYSKLQFYGNSKIYFRSNLIGKFGYILNNRNYSELPEFSYWEHYLYAQMNTFFQTGTSITMIFNYGLKNYIPLQISSNWRNPEFFEMPSVDQLVSSIKVAQSLGDKTSLSLKYLNRLNPGLVTGSAAVMNTDDLFTEDELFDDRYGYRGHEFSLNFTHYLPAYIKFELGSVYYLKDYHNRQLYDIDGNLDISGDTRSDQRSLIWGGLSRSFAVNWGIKNIKLSLQGGYLKNDSNAGYYRFDNYFGSLGLQFRVK